MYFYLPLPPGICLIRFSVLSFFFKDDFTSVFSMNTSAVALQPEFTKCHS